MDPELKDLLEGLKKEAEIDFIGLWEIIKNVRRLEKNADTASDLMSKTLSVVELLLADGFEAGYPAPSGNRFEPWQNQSPQYVVARIKDEWEALGREPNIGEVAWFSRPE